MLQAILFASGLVFTTKIIKNVWINENYAKFVFYSLPTPANGVINGCSTH